MKTSRILAALAGLFVTGISSIAAAQLVCTPGQGCRVVLQPPPLTYQPPPVTWQSPHVQVDPSIQAQAQWQAELGRRARWDEYFQWRAQVWASAQASINAQVYIEPLKYQARMTPDPLAYSSAGYGAPGNDYVSFPRVAIGFLALCLGAYSGPGAPTYAGYCPAVRFHVDSSWAVAIDPAYVTSLYDDRSIGMFGLRPGVEYAFAHGRRDLAASRAYVVGGLDLWFPTTGGATTPTAFLGGHVGLGAMISGGRWGIGTEVRALIRGGVGNGDDGFARAMSTFRVGFETRPFVVQLSFW